MCLGLELDYLVVLMKNMIAFEMGSIDAICALLVGLEIVKIVL